LWVKQSKKLETRMSNSRRIFAVVAFTLLLHTAGTAGAQEVGKYTFKISATSAGPGLEIAYAATEKWRFRGMLAQAPADNKHKNIDGVPYEISTKLAGLAILADYRLGRSIFRLTGGAFISRSSRVGSTSGSFTINGTRYTADLDVDIRFANKVAPVVAVGFDLPLGKNKRWALVGDLGYIYTNGVEAELNVSVGSSVSDEHLSYHRDKILEQYGSGYPFLTLGLSYSF
jgi:hypothetical protein